MCEKVALLGDGGSTLWQRIVSNFHSMLRISTFLQPPQDELEDKAIDIDQLNNYDILERVR